MMTSRASYSNIMSTLAVFIALGGTSYAVAKLPRNSVGSSQLRSNAVTGSKVRNGSLGLVDLSSSARLSGARGPRGREGPPGPAGAAGPAGLPQVLSAPTGGAVTPGPANTRVQISELSLPAGSWLLQFNAEGAFFPTGNPHELFQRCGLEIDGAQVAISSVVLGDSGPATVAARHVMSAVSTRPGASTARVVCTQDRDFDAASGSNRPYVGGATLQAIRVVA